MTEVQKFKRFPAAQCWIKHILESTYLHENKSFFTVFGKVKRVRILATIMDKREMINAPTNSMDTDETDIIEEDDSSNVRIEFDLDDSTGQIRGILWGADPEDYIEYKRGDIVEVIGLLRRWKTYTSLSPEIIKKVENPNTILLRNAEIIKHLKFGELHEIPEISESEIGINEVTEEIDVDALFEGENGSDKDNLKNKIFVIIEKHSSEGNGISFDELKKKIQIPEEDLRKYIRDLVMESKIYQSDENIYESY